MSCVHPGDARVGRAAGRDQDRDSARPLGALSHGHESSLPKYDAAATEAATGGSFVRPDPSMSRLRPPLASLLLLLSACPADSSSSAGDDDGSTGPTTGATSDGDGDGDDADPTGNGASGDDNGSTGASGSGDDEDDDDSADNGSDGSDDSDGSTTGEPEPEVPMCVGTCEEAADCAQPSLLYGPDNYECAGGQCLWLGCNDDNECMATFMNPNMACLDVDGSDVPQCVGLCDVPNDCVQPSLLYDQNNWACTAGRCDWLGCQEDNECVMALSNGNAVCDDGGADVPQCVGACEDASDCTQPSPLYLEDNFACEAGQCVWQGCNDDAECQQAFMNANQVCAE